MSLLAEMIAAAFANVLLGRRRRREQVYCAQPELKRHEIMSAFDPGRP